MISFTIIGQPESKANSREIVTLNRRRKRDGEIVKMPASIKSKKALKYETSAILQIPPAAKQMLTGPLRITAKIYYEDERRDLDASIIKDVLQTKFGPVIKGRPREIIRRGVYINDRQVIEEHYYRFIDRKNPRAEIVIEPLQPQQVALSMPAPKPKETPRDAIAEMETM